MRRRRWPPKRLKDETTLIRFSRNDFKHLRHQIADCKEKRGYYGLSFFGDNRLSVEEVCERVRFANPKMQLVTVGTLRANGYDPAPEGRRPYHHAIKWALMPSDAEIGHLRSLFDPVEENPHIGP